MARTQIPVTAHARAGISPPAQTIADATNKHYFTGNKGDTVLEVISTDGSVRTVTLQPSDTFAPDGLTVTGETYSIPAAVKAALTTALAGMNNDLVFTADAAGPAGNSIRVRYVVAGNNTALSISVVGFDVTVNVATDGGGAAASTAAQVKTALDADAGAAALIDTANAPSNDGSGIVAALSYTNLAGGDWGAKIIGPWRQRSFNQSNGQVYVDPSVSTTLLLRAYRLTSTP